MNSDAPAMSRSREDLILGVIVVGTLMAAIDSTIVLLAFPAITSALHSTISTVIWVILIYMIVTAVFSTQFGRIGDIYGRGRMFNLGFVIFTVSSFLCGIAPTDITLIGFRGLQAVGGALLSSNSGAIIADVFPRNRIGRAYGFTSMSWNVGALLGILLGGFITTFIGYRYIFFINIPIGVVATILGLRYIVDKKTVKEKMDISGMALLGVAVALVTYGGIDYASSGLTATNLALLLVGTGVAVIFVLAERRTSKPTIDFAMFKNRVFKNSLVATFFQGMGFLGVTFLLIMYLQGVRGFSPFYASLVLLPAYVIGGVLSPYMGKLSDKYGSKLIATYGILLIMAGVIFYILLLNAKSSIYLVMTGSIIMGIGGALFWPSNFSSIMANVAPRFRGAASGTARLIGSMGMIGSFILAFVAAATAIPRYMAFAIFAGTSNVIGGIGTGFVTGIHYSFIALTVMLAIAGVFSIMRGTENRHEPVQPRPEEWGK